VKPLKNKNKNFFLLTKAAINAKNSELKKNLILLIDFNLSELIKVQNPSNH
jgi:hypothetical protein